MLITTVLFFPPSQLTKTVCSVKSPEPPVEASSVRTHTATTPQPDARDLRPRPFGSFSLPTCMPAHSNSTCPDTAAVHTVRAMALGASESAQTRRAVPPPQRLVPVDPRRECANLLPTHCNPFLSVPGKKNAPKALDGREEDRVCKRAGRWKGGAIGCSGLVDIADS